MKLRAITRIRNEVLLAARERMNMTQDDLAEECGVPSSLIGSLERLQFPARLDPLKVALIADTLGVDPNDIFPPEMVNWKGTTTFSVTAEVETSMLLDYVERQEGHYLLPSPDDEAADTEKSRRQLAMMRIAMKWLRPQYQKVLTLRYGLGGEAPMTLEAVGKRLRLSGSRVRDVEGKSIRIMQGYFSSRERMRQITEILKENNYEEEDQEEGEEKVNPKG